jgi:antitoxin MazE
MYSIKTKIKKWGNSQGVRLPKAVLKAALMDENEDVEIIADEAGIHIKKVVIIETLTDLFKNYHGDYKPQEWETGPAIGKEVL